MPPTFRVIKWAVAEYVDAYRALPENDVSDVVTLATTADGVDCDDDVTVRDDFACPQNEATNRVSQAHLRPVGQQGNLQTLLSRAASIKLYNSDQHTARGCGTHSDIPLQGGPRCHGETTGAHGQALVGNGRLGGNVNLCEVTRG